MEFSISEKMSPEHFGREAPRLFAALAEWLQVPAESANHEGLRAFAPELARRAIADFYHARDAALAVKGKFSPLGKVARILAQFRAEIGFKREELLAALESHLRKAAGLFYHEIHDACQPLQSFCSKQLMIYEPRVALAKQMEETLGKTAGALGLPARLPDLVGTE
jgi:hypothetical protein